MRRRPPSGLASPAYPRDKRLMTNVSKSSPDNSVKNTRVTKRNYLPAILVFTLPWLADLIILGGASSNAPRQVFDAPVGLMMNGLYAAAPFALLAAAMRPRLRVSRALWAGAALTCALWVLFALKGRANALNTADRHGVAVLWLFIILMIWPFVVTIFMGVAAKFREPNLEGEPNEQA